MENLEYIKVGDRVILYFDNVQSMCEVKRLFKNLKAERDKVKTENAELKRRAREKFSSISNLAIEATERLESMWFKPPHVISLVREIANMAN